ncbi:MAG TPA: thiamine phosphate synthase [Pyrinomonadaceae bacterium]|nr:thiamine phosphate synthase [Pyrinomonadaceae bacterium]
MSRQVTSPSVYAITSGQTTIRTTPESPEFSDILKLVEGAVAAELSLVQIREKSLSARVLYELATRAAAITRGTATRLLVNDRFDVARAAGADGVHLTARSLPVKVVRAICGDDFLIGVSTHSLETALNARSEGADFIVFGPVFETPSKQIYGEPQGLERLREVTKALEGFSVIAIGGINRKNADECFRAGASGIAAIRLFNE